MTNKRNIYKHIDVSSGGSLIGVIDEDALMNDTVLKYYHSLADNLSENLEDKEMLYQKYQEYIQKLRKENEIQDY